MGNFDLDLRTVESELDEEGHEGRVVLATLDGTTPGREWVDLVEEGAVLLLHVEGDLNELAADFARDVRDMGGSLVHFRGFLVVTPEGVAVDNERLSG